MMPKIRDLQRKTVLVLKEARGKILELEDLEVLAVEFGMTDDADLIRKYITRLQNLRDDFRSVLSIRVNNLSDEIEEKDVLNMESKALCMQEHLKSTLKYVPGFIDDMNASYDECYHDLEAICEMRNRNKL
ncbi:MAG: hypothetical protein ACYDEF_06190 [Methanosarcina sp.]